ncbi:hypothetical protein PILCRDRAFT_76053 [Piloderma croceum F 1598]|uniref:Uncharacterized protein n=1 Tax=Piloderma croceum (strain F 1598) TaxID=765440 RepID=A0A0C3EZN7_PILCF|nr:hypothetical protein PILCRDRAFT_76053 [Piloderma croceum F 1598]
MFPPEPPTDRLKHKIIADWCKDTSPDAFEEAGCAVCGQSSYCRQLLGAFTSCSSVQRPCLNLKMSRNTKSRPTCMSVRDSPTSNVASQSR